MQLATASEPLEKFQALSKITRSEMLHSLHMVWIHALYMQFLHTLVWGTRRRLAILRVLTGQGNTHPPQLPRIPLIPSKSRDTETGLFAGGWASQVAKILLATQTIRTKLSTSSASWFRNAVHMRA